MIYNINKFNSDSFCLCSGKIIGNKMIYKSLIFENDFIEKLTDEIIQTRIDDINSNDLFTNLGEYFPVLLLEWIN